MFHREQSVNSDSGFQDTFKKFMSQNSCKEIKTNSSNAKPSEPVLIANTNNSDTNTLQVDMHLSSKNDSVEENASCNDEVSPALQNALKNALDELEEDSVYFIPAQPIQGCLSPLKLCSKNGKLSVDRKVKLFKDADEPSSDPTDIFDGECIVSTSPVTEFERVKLGLTDESGSNGVAMPFENSSVHQPKVVVQMTPTYPGFPDIPGLGNFSESDQDFSDSSDTTIPNTSANKNSCSEALNAGSSSGTEDSVDKQSTKSEFTLENVGENSNVIKIRRRFRCPPSAKCKHQKDLTLCSLKVDNSTSPDTDAIETGKSGKLDDDDDAEGLDSGDCHGHDDEKIEKRRDENQSVQGGIKRLKKLNGNLDFKILLGCGERLGDIPCIAAEIDDAVPEHLYYLHKVLFDCGDTSESKRVISKTKGNILQFCGYPFLENSMAYKYKQVRLNRLHSERLRDVASILFGSSSSYPRAGLAEKILSFLMKPDGEIALQERLAKKNKKKEEFEVKENKRLINMIMRRKDLVPRVVLTRLTEEQLNRHLKRLDTPSRPPKPQSSVDEFLDRLCQRTKKRSGDSDVSESKRVRHVSSTSHEYPQFLKALIQKSASKCFPKENQTGKLSSDCENDNFNEQRRSLREQALANGDVMEPPQHANAGQCSEALSKSLENVLSSLASAGKEISNFANLLLASPKNNIGDKGHHHSFNHCTLSSKIREEDRILFQKMEKDFQQICETLSSRIKRNQPDEVKKNQLDALRKSPNKTALQAQSISKNGLSVFSQSALSEHVGQSLRSFQKICLNVECATPRDLSALHDLIYAEPCHDVEIHKRILDFNGFSFKEDSFEYTWRKTLLCHMDEFAVQGILKLLDLCSANCGTDRDEMSSRIMKFLMEPNDKQSCTPPGKAAHIVKLKSSSCIPRTPSMPYETPSNTSCNSPSSSGSPPSLEPYDVVIEKPLADKSLSWQESVQSENLNSKSPVAQNLNSMELNGGLKWSAENSWSSDDKVENLPIQSFFGHPSEKQLRRDIEEILSEKSNDITIKGIVDMVLLRYPRFNLRYRVKFLKSEIWEVLSTLQPTMNRGLSTSNASLHHSSNQNSVTNHFSNSPDDLRESEKTCTV